MNDDNAQNPEGQKSEQQSPQQQNRVNRNEEDQRKYAPANPEAEAKSAPPDPDTTDPATLPTMSEEADVPVQQSQFGGEHKISSDHAEPTRVTKTSNDNFIEGKYIDVGGGD